MEKKKTVLILDFGTSNVRANMIEVGTGEILESVSVKNKWIRPRKGWAEMEPEKLWENAQTVVARVIGLNEDKYHIISMGFSYFGDSLIAVDKDKNPLCGMIMAFDTRAQEEAAYIENKIGKERFREITGGLCLSMLVCSKILWLKNHRPDIFKETCQFLNLQEFILDRLGVGTITDYTLANRKALFNIEQKVWSDEIIEVLGIKSEQLAGTVEHAAYMPGRILQFGRVKLPYEIPFILGAHDSDCGFLGLGVEPGDIYTIGNVSGTYEMIGSFTDEYIRTGPDSLAELGCGLRKEDMVVSGSSIAGTYIEWFQKVISKSPGTIFEDMERKVCYTGRDTVYFLADNDRHTYMLDGFDISTSEEQIYQAIIEGITFKLKSIMDEMEKINEVPYSNIRCGGGGSASDKWLQFKADLFQKEVKRVVNPEVSSVGAAIIAAVGVGYYENFGDAIRHMVQIEKIFKPNKEISDLYQMKYQKYCKKMNQ